MQDVSRHLLQYAQQLACGVQARALVVYTDVISRDEELALLLQAVTFPVILISRTKVPRLTPRSEAQTWVTVPETVLGRTAQFKSGLLVCLARGLLRQGDRVVFLGGVEGSETLDIAFVFDVGTVPELFSLEDAASFAGDVAPEVFERVLGLAGQLAAEGREGRPVGTLFVVGDSERVLAQSRSLVLNPFQGHPESVRNILDPAVEETVKEFAGLDGAFVVRDDGVILAAGIQLMPATPHAALPGGLGTRHAAAAGITASSGALAVCISQSTGTITVFKAGGLVTSLQRPPSGTSLAGRRQDGRENLPGGRPRTHRRSIGSRPPRSTPAGRSES